jgi:hypothetical protein
VFSKLDILLDLLYFVLLFGGLTDIFLEEDVPFSGRLKSGPSRTGYKFIPWFVIFIVDGKLLQYIRISFNEV